MAKELTDKQMKAIELLTCGDGLTYKEICEQVGIDRHTLWDWRNEPQFTTFQEELKRINDDRWEATVDAARKSAFALVMDCNPSMVKFILQNAGYNPATKIDADMDMNVAIEIDYGDSDESSVQ